MAAEGIVTFSCPPLPVWGTACRHVGDGSTENVGWLWKGWARGSGGRQAWGSAEAATHLWGSKQRARSWQAVGLSRFRWLGQRTFHVCRAAHMHEACISVPVCFLLGTIDELSYPRPALHLCTRMLSIFLRTSLSQLFAAALISFLNSGSFPSADRDAAIFYILNKTLL